MLFLRSSLHSSRLRTPEHNSYSNVKSRHRRSLQIAGGKKKTQHTHFPTLSHTVVGECYVIEAPFTQHKRWPTTTSLARQLGLSQLSMSLGVCVCPLWMTKLSVCIPLPLSPRWNHTVIRKPYCAAESMNWWISHSPFQWISPFTKKG